MEYEKIVIRAVRKPRSKEPKPRAARESLYGTLRDMAVGTVKEFPMSRMRTILGYRGLLNRQESAKGYIWRTEDCPEKGVIRIRKELKDAVGA